MYGVLQVVSVQWECKYVYLYVLRNTYAYLTTRVDSQRPLSVLEEDMTPLSDPAHGHDDLVMNWYSVGQPLRRGSVSFPS